MYFALLGLLGDAAALASNSHHPALQKVLLQTSSSPADGADITAALLSGSPVSILDTAFSFDATSWLTEGYTNAQVARVQPVYLATKPGTFSRGRRVFCTPTISSTLTRKKANTKECWNALATYILTGAHFQALQAFNAAADDLTGSVSRAVSDSNSDKGKLDSLIRAFLLGANSRDEFAAMSPASRAKTRQSLASEELATANFMSVFRPMLADTKQQNESISAVISRQSTNNTANTYNPGNLERFETARTNKLNQLVEAVRTAIYDLWPTHKRNIVRLTDLANGQLLAAAGNITEASQGWTEAVQLGRDVYAALNETEADTISTMTANVTRLNNSLIAFDNGVDAVVRNNFTALLTPKRTYLTNQLSKVTDSYNYKAAQIRAVSRAAVAAELEKYDSSFALADAAKAFSSAAATLNVTVGNQKAQAALTLQQILDNVVTRFARLNATLNQWRPSDKANSASVAEGIRNFIAELSTQDSDLLSAGNGLLQRIEASKRGLLAQVRGDSSAQMNDVFANVIKALTEVAAAKKAAMEDANAKIASMEAAVAQMLASSGISAEEFFAQVASVLANVKASKEAAEAAASGTGGASNAQRQSVGSSVLGMMAAQAGDLAMHSLEMWTEGQSVEAAARSASNQVLLTAKTEAASALGVVQDASVEASQQAASLTAGSAAAGLGLATDSQVITAALADVGASLTQLISTATSASADEFGRFDVSGAQLVETANRMLEQIASVYQAVTADARRKLDSTTAEQKKRIADQGASLSTSIRRISDRLTSAEDSFSTTVNTVKSVTLQDALDQISAAIAVAWSSISENSLNRKIPNLQRKSDSDLATAQAETTKTVLDATAPLAAFVQTALGLLGVDKATTQAITTQGGLTRELAGLKSTATGIYDKSDGVLSSSSDSASSGVADVLALGQRISDFMGAVSPAYAAVNKTVYDRKAALDKSITDFETDAVEVFNAAKDQYASDFRQLMDHTVKQAGDLKTLLAAVSAPGRSDSYSSAGALVSQTVDDIRSLLSNLTGTADSFDTAEESLRTEEKQQRLVNVLGPLVRFLEFVRLFVADYAQSDRANMVGEVAMLTGAVAQSTWRTAQALRDKISADLARSSSGGKMNNHILRTQLSRNVDLLSSTIQKANEAGNSYKEIVDDVAAGAGDAFVEGVSTLLETEAEMRTDFVQGSTLLSDLQSHLSSSLADSRLALGDLKENLDALISESTVKMLHTMVSMADQMNNELPQKASSAENLEMNRIVADVAKAGRKIKTTAAQTSRLFRSANTTARSLQLFADKFGSLGNSMSSIGESFSTLQAQLLAEATKAANDAIAAEKARIDEEMHLMKTSLSQLKRNIARSLSQLGS